MDGPGAGTRFEQEVGMATHNDDQTHNPQLHKALIKQVSAQQEAELQVPHDLTQEELAELVGSCPETVHKALMDFANRGWIAREVRTIII